MNGDLEPLSDPENTLRDLQELLAIYLADAKEAARNPRRQLPKPTELGSLARSIRDAEAAHKERLLAEKAKPRTISMHVTAVDFEDDCQCLQCGHVGPGRAFRHLRRRRMVSDGDLGERALTDRREPLKGKFPMKPPEDEGWRIDPNQPKEDSA